VIEYIELIDDILSNGTPTEDRTGTGTIYKFGGNFRHNMAKGFPLLTTKRVAWPKVMTELLWFLRGDTNVAFLQEHGAGNIWEPWADADGNLGPVYGAQWMKQLPAVIQEIKTNPTSRRLIVDSWQIADIPKMRLPPCHMFFQFDACTPGRLSLQWYQRSVDVGIGLPFNIASYALLLEMVAYLTDRMPDQLIASFGNVHIYNNHVEALKKQSLREPRHLPDLHFEGLPFDATIYDFRHENIKLHNYDPHPGIKLEVSV